MSRGRLQRYWLRTFALITLLVLAQVSWWAFVFTRDANRIAELEASQISPPSAEQIEHNLHQRKRMVFSEAFFFAFMTCFGLWLLYRALEKERQSREAQRSFIEVFSHESKTPLTALKLRLESLREKTADPQEADGLNRALEEVRRLTSVFEKAMNLNRTESQALRFENIPLAEVVESVVRRLHPWLEAQGAQCELALDESVCVEGDFASLQTSVQGLLENAVLYNPSLEKHVRLEVFTRGAKACLRVADNGPGVGAQDAPLVFERFYRGRSGKTVPGTGLGLYLARTVVEAHRGILRLVKSEMGACFEMELPQRSLA
ncbi:HAMP domain-containing histidine kinase [bacterium]|nr:HAMP domain-containing histidine kinase [bacterium]